MQIISRLFSFEDVAVTSVCLTVRLGPDVIVNGGVGEREYGIPRARTDLPP